MPKRNDMIGQRRADALERMAEGWTAQRAQPDAESGSTSKGITRGDRYAVTVSVDAEDLMLMTDTTDTDQYASAAADNDALPNTEKRKAKRQRVSAATLERIGCDCTFIAAVQRDDGKLLNVGRRTRVIPPAIRCALQITDGGCTFAGCTHHHFVDAHHIQHWAQGGETKLDNLTTLCRRHHRLVHEFGYTAVLGDAGITWFVDKYGNDLANGPPLEKFKLPEPSVKIEELNAQHGIHPTADDVDSLCDGTRMHYGDCVGWLCELDDFG